MEVRLEELEGRGVEWSGVGSWRLDEDDLDDVHEIANGG